MIDNYTPRKTVIIVNRKFLVTPPDPQPRIYAPNHKTPPQKATSQKVFSVIILLLLTPMLVIKQNNILLHTALACFILQVNYLLSLGETPEHCISGEASNQQCIEQNSSTEKGPKQYKWNIDEKHRCNIKKYSYDDLHKKFKYGLPPLYHEPIIIYRSMNSEENEKCDAFIFTNMMSYENITNTFGEEFSVTLSSSNSFSAHRRTTSLSKYLEESSSEEILPSNLSNMTWYLFGETYSNEWKDALRHYCLPPCQTCTSDLR